MGIRLLGRLVALILRKETLADRQLIMISWLVVVPSVIDLWITRLLGNVRGHVKDDRASLQSDEFVDAAGNSSSPCHLAHCEFMHSVCRCLHTGTKRIHIDLDLPLVFECGRTIAHWHCQWEMHRKDRGYASLGRDICASKLLRFVTRD